MCLFVLLTLAHSLACASSPLQLNLEFISFVSCPSSINEYLDPSKTAASVSWARPTLPSIYMATVPVTSSLGAWQAAYSFNVGTHTVTYSTEPLDLGGKVVCEFTVSIYYGFKVTVTDIGHIATSSSLLDFMVDDAGVSNGGSQIPAFNGDVLGEGLSIGILSPPKKPFSLFLRPNFKTKLVIQLTWCETGVFPTDLTDIFAPTPAQVCAASRGSCTCLHVHFSYSHLPRTFSRRLSWWASSQALR